MVLMIHVDHSKPVNDEHGNSWGTRLCRTQQHRAPSPARRLTSRCCAAAVGPADRVRRIG